MAAGGALSSPGWEQGPSDRTVAKLHKNARASCSVRALLIPRRCKFHERVNDGRHPNYSRHQ